MTDNCTATSDDSGTKSKDFICGVVEGFYGRPWTTEQRKDLFQKLRKWGMDSYVYAPKDDYKHRAYWRELYTVEEAEHLTSLIAAAKAQNIVFYYALSPGLDITYSSQKEITALKRKLEQVSQFGCTAFALLFDDIEPEMSEADKQIFQSFAHAQVSVTNEIHQHLGSPGFLLCPTQYCSTRAVPTVNNSEYLNTLGSKLSKEIDIMWTGPKVISKVLSSACIEEITQVLKRPPVIWDNLHANDYDQKRVFLGPYCGRSPELIPLLRGVLTNPNCEYNANMVPVRTLAHWANCSLDAPSGLDAVSSDIKLERESEEGVCEDDLPVCANKHIYHHRQALKNAISEWLPEFSIPKESFGPIMKPQPIINVVPVPIIPILPSVNTCMTLTTPTSATTTTSSAGGTLTTVPAIPTLSTSQLQALTDVCTNITPMENFNPITNPIMNSLVSATKVVMNESIPNPILPLVSSNISLPTQIPVSTISVPLIGLKNLDPESQERQTQEDEPIAPRDPLESETDQAMTDETSVVQNGAESPLTMSPSQTDTMECLEPSAEFAPGVPTTTLDADVVMTDGCSENGSMQVEPACSPVGSDMMVEANDVSNESSSSPNALTVEDLSLLCDLLYLPFEHGARAMRLMHDFNWLKSNATVLLPPADAKDRKGRSAVRPETSEWRRRCARFLCHCVQVWRLARRLALCLNKELAHDLFAYVWDLCGIVSLLSGYAQWLALAKFPPNVVSHTHGSYTWFSAGWKEAFTSGEQEPWVFRGGLGADLRRLVPVECAGCELLARPAAAIVPIADSRLYSIRPYALHDEVQVCNICHKTCRDGMDCTELFPTDLQTLPADRLVTPFLTLTPEFCMVIQDETDTLDGGLAAHSKSSSAEKIDNGLESEERSKRDIVGYACAALDSRIFYRKQEVSWVPEMVKKYPLDLLEGRDLSQAAKECIQHFHSFSYSLPESVARAHPSILCCSVLPRCQDPAAPARLLTCLLAALRANGSFGVHVCINSTDHYMHQFYSKLGFTELTHEAGRVYLGRTF